MRWTWIAAAALAAASGGLAQDRRGPGPDGILGGTPDELKDQLGLSEEQTKKVQDLFTKTKEGLDQILQSGRWREMREFREAARSAVRELLTEEQKGKYETVLQNRGEGRGREEISMEDLKRRLELTEEQAERIGRLRQELQDRLGRARDDARQSGNWDRLREESERLRAESNEEIKRELTDDQKKKYDELLAERRQGERETPAQRADRLVREMGVEEAKAADLKAALVRVIELQRAQEEQLRTLQRQVRELLRNGAAEGEVDAKLEELRKKRDELDGQLAEAQKALMALVNRGQEARLVSEGHLK
jgi:Spy/CpxP family protein refolding chaperone